MTYASDPFVTLLGLGGLDLLLGLLDDASLFGGTTFDSVMGVDTVVGAYSIP
jgi:hypothetical protein